MSIFDGLDNTWFLRTASPIEMVDLTYHRPEVAAHVDQSNNEQVP